ncbi:hypothetical protein [Paracoccus salsus]|nr:hypothetical protein [Paracoccus salsus]
MCTPPDPHDWLDPASNGRHPEHGDSPVRGTAIKIEKPKRQRLTA